MYGRKLKGDKIRLETDVDGALNRSHLSVWTVPSVKATEGADGKYPVSKLAKARVLSGEFCKLKETQDRERLYSFAPVSESISSNSIPLPKKRNERRSTHSTILSKLGKRISTFGGIIDNFESKFTETRAASIANHEVKTCSDEHDDEYEVELEELHQKTENEPPYQTKFKADKLAHYLYPKEENQYQKENSSEADETISLQDAENSTVYSKNNQLYLNFPNGSAYSLVQELLTTYSQLKPEDSQTSSLKTISLPQPQPNIVFYDCQSPNPSTNRDSTCTSNSAYGSSKNNDDLFSFVPSDTRSNLSSEGFSSSECEGVNTENYLPLITKNYNKKLPAVPPKEIDQFKLRDYNDSEINPIIIDESIPPELPSHEIMPKSATLTPETMYFDCIDNFPCFPPAKPKVERKVKKQVEIQQDTKVFTRSTSRLKNKGNVSQKLIENKHKRTSSTEYLKQVGIDPFMLSGYQDNVPLTIRNP